MDGLLFLGALAVIAFVVIRTVILDSRGETNAGLPGDYNAGAQAKSRGTRENRRL